LQALVKFPSILSSNSFRSFLLTDTPFESGQDSNLYKTLVGVKSKISGLNINDVYAYMAADNTSTNIEEFALKHDITSELPQQIKILISLHSQLVRSIESQKA
jgi:hypothetical protein